MTLARMSPDFSSPTSSTAGSALGDASISSSRGKFLNADDRPSTTSRRKSPIVEPHSIIYEHGSSIMGTLQFGDDIMGMKGMKGEGASPPPTGSSPPNTPDTNPTQSGSAPS